MEQFSSANKVRSINPRRKSRGSGKTGKIASVGQVRQMIKSTMHFEDELKYYVTSDTATGVGFSGTVSSLCTIPQGITDITRVGDSLNLEEIEFHYAWSYGDPTNACRLILFQWYPQSTPAVVNVLYQGPGTALAPYSPYNVDVESQYKILYDETIYVNNLSLPQVGTTKVIKIKEGFKRRLDFVAGSTTGSNQIYKLMISDSGAVPNPSLNSYSRVRYTDA